MVGRFSVAILCATSRGAGPLLESDGVPKTPHRTRRYPSSPRGMPASGGAAGASIAGAVP